MKIFKSIILGAAVLGMMGLSSCNDWLDVNQDPNNASSSVVGYAQRLAWCEHYTTMAYQIAASRTVYSCGLFTATSRTSRDGCSAQWQPTNSLCTSPYQLFFVGCGSNLNDLIKKAEAAEAWGYAGAGHLLRAYNYMLMTDLYGEMPYKEGINDSIAFPKYDTGKTIFMGCINEIDLAIEQLSKTPKAYTNALSEGDSWNGGNQEKWLKMAYLLKARWINHLIKKGQGSYKEGKYDPDEILNCLAKAQQSNADNTTINTVDQASATGDVLWGEQVNWSELYSVQGMSTANRVTKQYVDNLTNFDGKGVEDPRADKLIPWTWSRKSADSPAEIKWDGNWRRSLGVDMHTLIRQQGAPYALSYNATTNSWYCNAKDENRKGDTVYVEMISGAKGYLGTPDLFYRKTVKGSKVETSKETAMFYNRPSSPEFVASYSEACFIKAEVLFRKGDKAGAYDAYKAGVKASIDAMNDKLNVWYGESDSYKDCPSFKPMTQADIQNFLDNALGTSGDLTLGKIMTQKQIAMIYSGEVWNDMRRYDYDPNIFFNWQIPAEYYVNSGSTKAIPEGKQWRRWRQCSHETGKNAGNLQAIGNEVPGANMSLDNWNLADDVWTIPVWWDSDQQ